MSARLICRSGELAGTVHHVSGSCLLGRDPSCQVVLRSGVVSSRHARVYEEGGAFYVEDLVSRNGTVVDGVDVVKPMRLGRLSVITLANTFVFVFFADSLTADGTPLEVAAKAPSAGPLQPVRDDDGMRTIAMPFDISTILPDLDRGSSVEPAVDDTGEEP